MVVINFVKENWFKLTIAISLILLLILFLVLSILFYTKYNQEQNKNLLENTSKEQKVVKEISAVTKQINIKSDDHIVEYDKDGNAWTWSGLDSLAIMLKNDTLNTYENSLPTFQKVLDEERGLLSSMYVTLAKTTIPEYRYQLQTLINYDEVYITASEKLTGLLMNLIKNYRGLLISIEKRDSALYKYYSEETKKLEETKKVILDDYMSKQNAKQNYAKSMVF